MSGSRCWGIFRERTHSPGRESDDAEILRLTGKHLEANGFQVVLKRPEEIEPFDAPPPCAFLMCERADILRQLRAWEASGVPQVNSPLAVLNTYRERMIAQLEEANVPFVESRIVPTAEANGPYPVPVWVKRADVHNTQSGDVVFAPTEDAVDAALRGLAQRGIPGAVIQPHLEGDLVKFYGVGTGCWRQGEPPWFRCFYHEEQAMVGHPFDPTQLAGLARRAAAALGLEVYGGDALVTAPERFVLLDLNAWPSFALYREEAAQQIAAHLAVRFSGDLR